MTDECNPHALATADEITALTQQHADGARFSLNDLLRVMAALRTPGIGCPWDAEQSYASIAPYTVEEAYEVADAIQRGDIVDLKDELGDLLFQVVFHAQIAAQQDHFTFEDVADGIARKMVRRHPHVFGDEADRAAGMTLGRWEQIKAAEAAAKRERKSDTPEGDALPSVLDGVPHTLPALSLSMKLQDRAARIGFDWLTVRPVFDKLKEEFAEFEAELAAGHADRMKDEFGDMLFVMANLARHLKIDPEAALRGTAGKFERRFRHIERRLHEEGFGPGEATLEQMDKFWDEAKAIEKEQG